MSYILDALKKAEQEREIGRVPGIVSGHEQVGRRSVNRWLWLVGVLAVNAIVLAIVLWPQSDTSAIAPVAAVVAPPAPEPTKQRSRAPVITVVQPVVEAKPVRPAPARESKPPAALRPLPPLAEPLQATSVEVPVARATAVAALSPNNNLPVWPQVSSQLFQQINSGLHLDVHVYSELPDQRFVLINMQKYNEGEQLQEGPVVDEITPEDVILSFRGQRFRVQSQ